MSIYEMVGQHGGLSARVLVANARATPSSRPGVPVGTQFPVVVLPEGGVLYV